MIKGQALTVRVQELVEGIHQLDDNRYSLYKELINIASADELGSQYTERDFNLYFPQNSLTVEEQVQVINRGYYKEFSNLVGFSTLPFNEDVNTVQLLQGIKRFIDCKLIPWIELSANHQEVEFTSFYGMLLNEFTELNKKYLGNDRQLGELIKRTGELSSRLLIHTGDSNNG